MGDKTEDVRALIERITSSERMRTSSHFSDAVYRAEPILTTGRQMATYLPDRYREMRAISRWQEGEPHGRWITEAELFWRQGTFMADFEDDCPYHGTFKAYFPTYADMSDRQLRGYFTWRTAVRRGNIQETSLSFAYTYLYELINGIGVANPLDGFTQLKTFWEAYRGFAPEIDRYVRVWLRDYVVYHGLEPSLLHDSRSLSFDHALIDLVEASAPYDPDASLLLLDEPESPTVDPGVAPTPSGATGRKALQARTRARKGKQSALPLPPNTEREDRLLAAIDALSSYRIRLSRLYSDHPDDLRHIACSVFVRMLEYYRKHRKSGLIESLFGELVDMPYTMFASAVFFESERHGPADIELDRIHRYRCRNGLWTCTRVFGARDKSPKLGSIMRGVDRKVREALEYPHPLKVKQMPKYLEQAIDREIEAWLTWKQTHAPRKVEIDLSQLAGIRSAAAVTREALLTDEERDQDTAVETVEKTPTQDGAIRAEENAQPLNWPGSEAELGDEAKQSAARNPEAKQPEHASAPAPSAVLAAATAPAGNVPPQNEGPSDSPLSPAQAAYLQALLTEDEDAKAEAVHRSGISEDMLVDAINEALFDLLGDTAIEFGSTGPQVIEDYEDDVRGVLA